MDRFKRAYQNELTRFRYDVVLYIGTQVSDHPNEQQFDWQADELSVASLQRLLKDIAALKFASHACAKSARRA